MTTIIQINKSGTIKENELDTLTISNLTKLCKVKGYDDIEKVNIWNYNKNLVHLYAFRDGKAGKENKYENPRPVDNDLYFGDIFYIQTSKDNQLISFNKTEFKKFYEIQMGGFEDLDKCSDEDSHLNSDNEYEEDSFLVKDSDIEDSEDEWMPDKEEESEEELDTENFETSTEEEIEEVVPKISKKKKNNNSNKRKLKLNHLFPNTKDELDSLLSSLDNTEPELTEEEIEYETHSEKTKKYKLGDDIIKIKITRKKKTNKHGKHNKQKDNLNVEDIE